MTSPFAPRLSARARTTRTAFSFAPRQTCFIRLANTRTGRTTADNKMHRRLSSADRGSQYPRQPGSTLPSHAAGWDRLSGAHVLTGPAKRARRRGSAGWRMSGVHLPSQLGGRRPHPHPPPRISQCQIGAESWKKGKKRRENRFRCHSPPAETRQPPSSVVPSFRFLQPPSARSLFFVLARRLTPSADPNPTYPSSLRDLRHLSSCRVPAALFRLVCTVVGSFRLSISQQTGVDLKLCRLQP